MIRNSVASKLWLTIVAMVFLVLALLAVLLQQFFVNYVVQRETEQLTRLATSVNRILPTNDPATAMSVLGEVSQNVLQAHVVAATPLTREAELVTAYHHFTPTQLSDFNLGKPVVVNSTVGGASELSVYQKLPSSTSTPGMVAVSQQMSVLEQPVHRMRNLIIFDTVLAIVLATGLAFVVSKNLSRPLVEMNKAAEEMALGHFSQRVEVVTHDEVGRLGNTFNALAAELAKTIEQLSIERDQLSSILSSLQDGVVATDKEGRVTLANPPALRRLRSMSVAERGIATMEKLPERLMMLFSHVTDFEEPVVQEATWEGRSLAITMLPLYEVDGTQMRGTLAVLRDVTEERRLDRLRKDFIANVSHELRTPLSMMQGYAEALLDDISDDPEMRRELTEIIHDETLRMKRLVNDLLDFAQLESGQFQMNMDTIDFSLVMRRVARKFQALAQDFGVGFELRIENEAMIMDADVDRMEQVFTNLLDNAFRHTSEGKITFSADISGRYVYVRVSDTGAGIPEGDVPYIFERFYKADKARTRSRSGTGLGLAIARHIVTEHGGDILVESAIGKGTTFTVILPIQRDDMEIDGEQHDKE
ncbi:cell wall metabolism sensor histidine kinase WalK [Alicyclobacillus fastidiosus]|uniref:histidine kinase n=1 Tax=Alicyclobacillus fastidiosus TaxID=392011 RepID=A0ABY6ZN28_9BACL|nr:ATP-binding protein [Alicyclobacillus fastidiosus]WAH44368.1 cell wall metabolism sensor histidine kinase WalK [Alicyclobacillus fastidiosus]GMA60700.1 sensor histidine kinase [Alicyclobacillus fastidiosus]